MKQPKLNVRLIRRIQKHILEEPRRFFMKAILAIGVPGSHEWDEVKGGWNPSDLSDTVPPCGTAACLAGWTGLLSGKTLKQTARLSFKWFGTKLGLPKAMIKKELGHSLFY